MIKRIIHSCTVIAIIGANILLLNGCGTSSNTSDSALPSQTSSSTSFITQWGPIDSSTSISIPLDSSTTYHFNINWGDGSSIETIQGQGSSLTVDHTYSSNTPSVDITITPLGDSGTTGYNKINFGTNLSFDCSKLLNIKQWGLSQWTALNSAFQGCNNLVGAGIDSPNLSGVTNINSMFNGASSFNSDISNWDTSNVNLMSSVFYEASSFNGNISNWDVSNVTTMGSMFYNASSFNNAGSQDITNWNTSKVRNMHMMFARATLFNQNISNWNVSSVPSGMHDGIFDEAGSMTESFKPTFP